MSKYLDLLKLPKILSYLDENIKSSKWTIIERIIHNTRQMKYKFLLPKTETVVVTLAGTLDGTSAIYAIVYFVGDEPRYVCTGPTFRSQDGEYRSRMIRFDQLMAAYEIYNDLFARIEGAILPQVEEGRLTFHANFYPVADKPIPPKVTELVSGRLPIRLFLVAWLTDVHNLAHKVVENHINPAYQFLMNMDELGDDFDKIFGADKQLYHFAMYKTTSHFAKADDPMLATWPLQVGLKTFPLSAAEATAPDIRFDVWREIYASNLASNLVLNLISPSFPFINNWFYVQHAHGALFDNFAMHTKFEHSTIAVDITRQLHELDRLNYSGDVPISPQFGQLSRKMRDATDYAEADLALTDLALTLTSEYVGRTLRDIPALLASNIYPTELGCVFRHAGIFRGHILEFMYAIYTMNVHASLIHGDLHMNNVTIMQLFDMFDADQWAIVPNAKKAYIVSPDLIYHADHVGTFSMIIDFSRAIIGDRARVARDFDEGFAATYFEEQNKRLGDMILHYVPKLAPKEPAIRELIRTNFALAFKICTVIDAFVLCTNFAALFAIDPVIKTIRVADGNVDLLEKIASMAERLLNQLLLRALAGSMDADTLEWPVLTVIKHIFERDRVGVPSQNPPTAYHDPTKPPTYVDIFNGTNEIIYDVGDHDSWGPILAVDADDKIRAEYGAEERPGIGQWREFKHFDETEAINAIVAPWMFQ